MNYLNITKYDYLAVAGFMFYDAFTKWNDATSDGFWLSFIFAVSAVFLYFCRSRFAKKFAERDRQEKSKQS